MAAVKHSNFFSTTLATPPTGTTEAAFAVTSATNLPTLGAGDWTYAVIKNASLTREVIKIGTISGVTLTPASGGRGADGSTAYASWLAGDVIELCVVNASLLDLLYGFKEAFYNTAKTFKSVFANANTAARTYTFPDQDGTVVTDKSIHAATNKATPVGADEVGIWDSVSGILNRLSLTNLFTWMRAGFDSVYAALSGASFSGAINEAYATVASASTTAPIWSAAGNLINYTGVAVATDFPAAPQAGARRTLICAGGCGFNQTATISIPGGSNYVASAGDIVTVYAITTTTFRLDIVKASGAAMVSTASNGEFRSRQVFATNGTYTKPAGLVRAVVIVVGPGGGGGGGSGGSCGASGGGGGYGNRLLAAVSLAGTEAVAVGTGGAGGAGSASGSAGSGDTSFGNTPFVWATAGGGGAAGSGSGSAPGAAGVGSGGEINLSGQSGCAGGSSTAGGTAGSGGSSFMGGGGGGGYNTTAGGNSGAYGGGGGGGGGTSAGGNGAGGIVIVEEYF